MTALVDDLVPERAMVAPVLAAPPRLRMAARAAFPTATPRSGACWRARGNGANLVRLPVGAIEGGWHGLEARGRGPPGIRCRSGQAVLQRTTWLQRRRRQPDGGVLSERPADAPGLGVLSHHRHRAHSRLTTG